VGTSLWVGPPGDAEDAASPPGVLLEIRGKGGEAFVRSPRITRKLENVLLKPTEHAEHAKSLKCPEHGEHADARKS